MNAYKLVFFSAQAHLFEVELSIAQPDPDGQLVCLPSWIRGSYMVRDFARNIISISAFSGDQPVVLEKLDKQSWRAAPVSAELRIVYRVYAHELGVRSAHFDTQHAYFNGSSLFLSVAGQEERPCRLSILAPSHSYADNWRLATGMPAEHIDDLGFGDYLCDNYEALIDYPVEAGEYTELEFSLEGRRHRFVISGVHDADGDRLCGDLRRICHEEAELFGELPISDYLFLLQVVGDGYGGLEHRNSSSLMISRDDLPAQGDEKVTEGYRRLLALCSHEYFHLWHVKRITPEIFLQRGTAAEVYTRQLWIFEGITSYYDELVLVRSGVIERKAYFEMMAETVTRVMRGSGRLKQTLEESSFDAWTKFYKQDENAPNAIVSYYAKGALFALLLDLTIRLRSDNRFSLDHVMREMWQRYGRNSVGVAEHGFEKLVADVTSLDLQSLFGLGVRSTRELPLAEALAEFAIELHLLPAENSEDKGKVVTEPPKTVTPKPVLGAKWKQCEKRIRLLQVFDGGGAQLAGLSAGDEIVALDGLHMSGKQMEKYLARKQQGASVELHFFRRDELRIISLAPLAAEADTCTLYLPQHPGSIQQQRLNIWLKGHVPTP
ncbi:MAG: PDZ domain-containing protein [Candidatus Thiodiazotropha sp. (ex Ctena orbiculata)]|uniref:PDZ domain-containing protein n=1 Tax=Candidatus Thiodiazotropha taylori TaxID=2792791 RepID=A0A944M8C1_9GAMM|nr:PDZ domain-containing protein [Candidatus Thiodiazotropha taylori]MBT3025634.1 PDZ domain-containing protein [Candidatus Thiodiazotropha taylori]MBT3033893.1 PDZ domain-containing protein [Candidatus Thiodiazotropha taylori]MBV2135438.1 PDZ domain-containing protein [Candidatus Thiodiazotropha taylori]